MEEYVQAGLFSVMPQTVASPSSSSPTLLIVDDQPLLAEFMASVAEDAGWNAEMALTAEEFEAKVKAHQPDAVALDLAMPDRDGVELLRQLASNGFSGSLIIVSACDRSVVESSAMLAREHGLAVTGFSQKPITAADFAAMLERAKATTSSSAFDRCH